MIFFSSRQNLRQGNAGWLPLYFSVQKFAKFWNFDKFWQKFATGKRRLADELGLFHAKICKICFLSTCVQFVSSYQLVYNVFSINLLVQFVSYQLVYNVFSTNLCTNMCIYIFIYIYKYVYIYVYVFYQLVYNLFPINLFPLYVCILGRRYTHVCMCRVSVWSIY